MTGPRFVKPGAAAKALAPGREGRGVRVKGEGEKERKAVGTQMLHLLLVLSSPSSKSGLCIMITNKTHLVPASLCVCREIQCYVSECLVVQRPATHTDIITVKHKVCI